jgi:hypothetical protein
LGVSNQICDAVKAGSSPSSGGRPATTGAAGGVSPSVIPSAIPSKPAASPTASKPAQVTTNAGTRAQAGVVVVGAAVLAAFAL